ncbi:MAG TPA: crotonase/enoyl-CoA hydratase family protein [Acidimicrobiales bacterium]|nr:crotonase/enoyl-CoA hydratase family protein [Acidimicrobiales bacterium]
MPDIALDLEDRILTITLDRPDRLNAFTVPMQRELVEALDRVDEDPDVRVVVVTGRGRGFCAGADLAFGADTFDIGAGSPATGGGERRPHRDEGGLVTLRLYQCTKPVIAAINGPAVGVGATMTLPMDVRLASETARFGFVFARRGIVPEACSSWFLPRVVGINTALEWTFTGRVFGADEALARGLVRSVHAPDDLLPAAYELAREIADNTSAVSIAMTRQMLWRMLGEEHPMAAHRVDSNGIAKLGQSADAREGVTSFLEKRPPQFTDKVPADVPSPWPFWEEPDFTPLEG